MIRNHSVYLHFNLVILGLRADQLIERIGNSWKGRLTALPGGLGYAVSDDGTEIIIQVIRQTAADFDLDSDAVIGVYTTTAQIEAATRGVKWDLERGRVDGRIR